MRRTIGCRILFTLSALSSVGCYSTSLIQDARVLAPGKVRTMGSVSYTDKADQEGHFIVEAGLRAGIAPRVELQAKLANFYYGGGVALKVALLDEGKPLRLSLLTGAQGAAVLVDMQGEAWWETRPVFGAHLTPLLGVPFGELVELTIGPDVQAGFKQSPARRDPWFGLGLRVALSLHVTTGLTLIPECSVLGVAVGPPVLPGHIDDGGSLGRVPDSNFSAGDVRGQCGLGFNVGSRLHPVPAT